MSTLRSLLSVPEDAILTTYLHSLDDVTAKARVYTLLTNPYPSPTLQEEVTLLLKQEGLPSLFKAALSFLLFSLVVEGTRAEDPKRFELPNRMLDQAGVASFIYEFYDVDPFWRKPQLSLHQMGTTSYILRLRNEPKVLKIIKPRYLTDQTIAFNTENYKGRYSALSDSPYTPTIEISTSRYIVMQYIAGPTLREYMRDNLHGSRSGLEKVRMATAILSGLCDALAECQTHELCHLDLSPQNIIIQQLTVDQVRPVLIDFGYNYLLGGRIGATRSLTALQAYIAPELMESVHSGSYLSDIYSLGILLLEMLAAEALESQEVAFQLDSVWSAFPDFAKLIEVMIDNKPENRLAGVGGKEGVATYSWIKQQATDGLATFERIQAEDKPPLFTLLDAIPFALKPDLKYLLELYKRGQALKGARHADAARLYRWGLVAQGLQFLTVTAFGAILLAELAPVVSHALSLTIKGHVIPGFIMRIPHIQIGDNTGGVAAHWPGRLVGVSFGFLITRYYLSIFSSISARTLSRWTDCCIRGTLLFAFGPILWAVLYRPKDWPFCCFVGAGLIAYNNSRCYQLVQKSARETTGLIDLPRSGDMHRFLDLFSEWRQGMGLYSAFFLTIGLALRFGIAKDEALYAVIVAVFVNSYIYLDNCVKDAPKVRGGLERAFSQLARVREYLSRKPLDPAAAAPKS